MTSIVVSVNSQVLKGQVVDQKTQKELLGAVVTIKGSRTYTVTDINGYFSIKTNCTVCKLIVEYYDYPKTEIVIQKQEQQNIDLGEIKISMHQNEIMLNK